MDKGTELKAAGDMSIRNNVFLILFVILYCVSLLSVGFASQPSIYQNPKRFVCATRVQYPAVVCSYIGDHPPVWGDGQIPSCDGDVARDVRLDPNRHLLSHEGFVQYCDGWDKPSTFAPLGWEILGQGWRGAFFGVFAWFANVFSLIAVSACLFRSYGAGLIAASIGAVMGLQSVIFHKIPDFEAGLDIIIDHLSVGFYLWEGALFCLALHCLLRGQILARHKT